MNKILCILFLHDWVRVDPTDKECQALRHTVYLPYNEGMYDMYKCVTCGKRKWRL